MQLHKTLAVIAIVGQIGYGLALHGDALTNMIVPQTNMLLAQSGDPSQSDDDYPYDDPTDEYYYDDYSEYDDDPIDEYYEADYSDPMDEYYETNPEEEPYDDYMDEYYYEEDEDYSNSGEYDV